MLVVGSARSAYADEAHFKKIVAENLGFEFQRAEHEPDGRSNSCGCLIGLIVTFPPR